MERGSVHEDVYEDGGVEGVGRANEGGLHPSEILDGNYVGLKAEEHANNLNEKFVDIGERSRGRCPENSCEASGALSSSELTSLCRNQHDHVGTSVENVVVVKAPESPHAASSYPEKQQNHVTSVYVSQSCNDNDDKTKPADGSYAVCIDPENEPPDPASLAEGTFQIQTSDFQTDSSSDGKVTDQGLCVSSVNSVCQGSLTNSNQYNNVNNNGDKHSMSVVSLGMRHGSDPSEKLESVPTSSSLVCDGISTDIGDFPLHEMVDARGFMNLSDLMPDCHDPFGVSVSDDQSLIPISSEVDFTSLVASQSVSNSSADDMQGLSTFGQDDHSMYTNSEADADEDKEPLCYELQQGYRILREIMAESNKSINWPFMNAIDSSLEGCEDYYEQVKHPMWLKKMRDKFDNRDYKNITEFVADMRLMLENCYRYNGPDHSISKKGQRLETMMEQKLALLSRELREKTSIAATSGKPVEETKITGTRRRKVIVPHDSTTLLNQLRLEAQEREREARRQQIQERRQAQEAYQQELQSWEEKLFEDGLQNQMLAMWELPQIGHFLFLCAVPLNIGEVMQWELERCFLLPRESSTMQRVMTTLLSTPYQRTSLDRKPMMPYKVWQEKLRLRVQHWYKTLQNNDGDIHKTSEKLGLESKFFQVLGLHSPLEKKCYHELTYYQRVWLVKALCDWCLETQDSIREAVEAQPITEQRPYELGSDANGFSYLHFPQFCGADLRIYKQAPVRMSIENDEHVECNVVNRESPKKTAGRTAKTMPKKKPQTSKHKEILNTRPRDSRLRQNPRQICQFQVVCSDTEDDFETSTQRSSIIDTTTDLDSGQESSTQDSGISEDSDNNEPPSKMTKSGNDWLDKGTDVNLDLLIDATPSRLTRSLMRNLTKVFSSTSTPSASREGSPSHSGHHARPRRAGARSRKLPKSSRESTPSARSDTHSVDESPCSDSLHSSVRKKRGKKTRQDKQSSKGSDDDKDRNTHRLDKLRSDLTDDKSNSRSEDSSAVTQGNGEAQQSSSSETEHAKTEMKTGVECDAVDSESCVALVGCTVTSGSEDSNSDDKMKSESCDADAGDCGQTVIEQRDEDADDRTAVECISNGLGDYNNEEDGDANSSVPLPKHAIDKCTVLDRCSVKTSEMVSVSPSECKRENDEVDEDNVKMDNLKQSVDVFGAIEQSSIDTLLHKKSCVSAEGRDAPQEMNGGSGVTSGSSPGANSEFSGSPTPMDVNGEEVDGGSAGALKATKLRSTLPLPDSSPKRVAMEDEISLASTISAVDPNYRPDSPKYQNLCKVKAEPANGVVRSEVKPTLPVEKVEKEASETLIKAEPFESYDDNSSGENKPFPEASQSPDGDSDGKKEEKVDVKQETDEEQCEVILPEFGEFELVVTDLNSLRQLITKLAESSELEVSECKKPKMGKAAGVKCSVTELRSRLEYLLQELEPWEQKLNSLHKKAIIKMKKEQESYVDEREKEEIEDVWESEESSVESSEDEEEQSGKTEDVEEEEDKETEKETEEEKQEDFDTVGVTTRGGMKRKKKVISSDSAKRKKVTEKIKEGSIASSPNILQKKTSEHQMTKPAVVSTAVASQSNDVTLAIIGNQPVLVPTNQLANLKNALVLAQLAAKGKPSGVQPQITLLSNAGPGGHVLLTMQNPAELQEKTSQSLSATSLHAAISGSQSGGTDQKKMLLTTDAPVVLTGSQPLVLANPGQLTGLASSQSQQLIPTPPVASRQTSNPVVIASNKSSTAVEVTKPAVTCFNYSNISQLPPDVVHKLLKNQEQRLQQGVTLVKTAVTTQNHTASTASTTAASVSGATAYTKLLKAGLLPVAGAESRHGPDGVQQNRVSDASTMLAVPVTSGVVVQQTTAFSATSITSTGGVGQLVQATSRVSANEVNSLPVVSKDAVEHLAIPNLTVTSSPTKGQDDELAKDCTHFTLISSPPKPKYATNVTVKTLLENKHAQERALPGQTNTTTSTTKQISVAHVAEKHHSLQSNSSDAMETVVSSPAKVINSQPVKSTSLMKGHGQLQVPQGAGSQVQLLLPGKQQVLMQKSAKPVQLLQGTAGKVQLVQGPDGQLHLVQANAGHGMQLVQGVHGIQDVQLVQGAGGIQMVQQSSKLQLLPGTSVQQQVQVVQVPTGKQLHLNQNSTTGLKIASQPGHQLQKLIVAPRTASKQSEQGVAVIASTHNGLQQKGKMKEELHGSADAACLTYANVSQSVALPVNTAGAGQKPKSVHIGASGQKVILLTPQVAAQLQVAMAKKQAIDQAVKTVITSVTTSLPTACMKVSSPFEMPSRRPHRSVTITTPAMKAPIPAIQKDSITELKPIASSVSVTSHSSARPAIVSGVIPATTVYSHHPSGVMTKTQQELAQVSTVTSVFLGQAPQSDASNPVTLGSTHLSTVQNVQRNTTTQTRQPEVKLPQKNVGLRLSPQNILTSKGVIQGIVVPAGVLLSQVVLQQLKHISDTQGLSVFQQSQDGTLQQVFLGNRHVVAELSSVPQQALVQNVKPQPSQLLAANQVLQASVRSETQQLATSQSGQVAQNVKQLGAIPQKLVVSAIAPMTAHTGLPGKGQPAAKMLFPSAKPVQMALQIQPQHLVSTNPGHITGMETSLPNTVPSAVQLVKAVPGVLPRFQQQQMVMVVPRPPSTVGVVQTLSSLPGPQVAVVTKASLVGKSISAGDPASHMGAAKQLVQLSVGAIHQGKVSQASTEVKSLIAPKKQSTSPDGVSQGQNVAIMGGGLSVQSSTVGIGGQLDYVVSVASQRMCSAVAKEQASVSGQNEPELATQLMKSDVPVSHGRVSSAIATSSGAVVTLASAAAARQPSKLIVFNVNGKLMTAQGVPVNLTQGLVKVGNQVIGAQAGLRCQQPVQRVQCASTATVQVVGSNHQVPSMLPNSAQVLSSFVQPSLGEGQQKSGDSSTFCVEHSEPGDGGMPSALQVLANAANMTADSVGQ